MVITKDQLQYIVDKMPEQLDVAYVFDKILLIAKIEQARKEFKEGKGQEWEEFKHEFDDSELDEV